MFKDMTGQRYGRLVAIEPTDKRRNRIVIWRFRCDCGKIVERVGSDVRRGDTQSCGCLFHELASERGKTIGRTHGGYYDRLHRVWTDMLTRCRNPNHSEFHRYGGRGIKVCEAWEQSYQAFKDWAYLHGYDDSAPRGACTIDRIDVNAGYSPENCRFISIQEQSKNLSTNRNITIGPDTKCISDWAKVIGVSPGAIYGAERFRGISPENYIRYRLKHIGERYVKTNAVLEAAEKWQ